MRTQVGPLDIWQLENEFFLQPSINQFNYLQSKNYRVEELYEPEVERISITNTGSDFLVAFEGLIIDGLQQARMVSLDQIIEPGEQTTLDVVCVEQGRWGDEFSGDIVPRAPISVLAALRGNNDTSHPQSRVWNSVKAHQSRTQSLHTTSLPRMMESYRESRTWIPFREIEEFSLNPKSNGVAVSVQGEPLIVEFFSSPELLRSQFRGIVESVLWDMEDYSVSKTSNRNLIDFLDETTNLYDFQNSHIYTTQKDSVSFRSARFPHQRNPVHVLAINHSHPILV
jgi:hypothetical protein